MKRIFITCITFALATAFLLCSSSIYVFASESYAEGYSAGLVSAAEELPEAYNNDPLNVMYATSVKDQGSFGLCWAFSAVACAEIDAIKNHGAKSTLDLSEWHLAYFTYHGTRGDTGDYVELEGNTPYYDIGGMNTLATLTLSNRIGFADESVAKYSTLERYPYMELLPDCMYECSYKTENVFLYDMSEDIEEVKRAIYKYGAVSANYNSSEGYFNEQSSAQYCGEEDILSDHAVTVVGWDDSYSRENFNEGARPANDGAWLVKNSWGEGFGIGGYFWLSYEDTSISDAAVFDVAPVNADENLYQHDGGMSFQYLDMYKTQAIANVFTVDGSGTELLSAVGIGAADTTEASAYTLEIYVNPAVTTVETGVYQLGEPTYTQSGDLIEGFNRAELDKPILLKDGDEVIISVKTDMGILIDGDYSMDFGDGSVLRSYASVGEWQTLFFGGNAWIDVYDNESTVYNARIKAYTYDYEVRTPIYKGTPSVTLNYGEPFTDPKNIQIPMYDPITGETVSGSWQILDYGKVFYTGDSVTVRFIPDDARAYNSVNVEAEALTVAVAPEVDIVFNKTEYNAGDRISFTVNVSNPYNAEVSVKGSYELYYSIDGGERRAIGNTYFYAPYDSEGKNIEVVFEYHGMEGCYELVTVSEVIRIEAPDESETEPTEEESESREADTEAQREQDTDIRIYPNQSDIGSGGQGGSSDSDDKIAMFIAGGGLLLLAGGAVAVGGGVAVTGGVIAGVIALRRALHRKWYE